MKFLLAIVLALIAIACARTSNLAALQDIMNTLQESKSAQTLDADVEAFSKASTSGLLSKLKEMEQKLTAALAKSKRDFNNREAGRVSKEQKAAQDKVDANKRKQDAEASSVEDEKANKKAKKAADDEATHNRGVVAQIKVLKAQLKSVPFMVAALDKQLNDLLKEIADKTKEAHDAFVAAEDARKKALAAARKLYEDFVKEFNNLMEEIKNEREADKEQYESEKEQCEEELALIERIVALVDPSFKLLGSITAGPVNNHLISSFNDGGAAYNKIKIVNKGGSYVDWARGHARAWKSSGLDIGKVAVKLDGKWYTASGGPHKCGYGSKYTHLPRGDFQIKKGNSECYNAGKNKLNTCGDVVVINTKGKKFQGLSDIETIGGCWKGDNKFRQNFDVYGYN